MYKVSVVTIVYNDEKNISRTIESVLSQTYKNIEYVCIDGKSSDHTYDIMSQYAGRVAHMLCEKDDGISDAFNKGISLSSGDFVLILNSGDVYLSADAIKNLMSQVMDESVYVAKSAVIKNGEIQRIYENDCQSLGNYMSVSHNAMLIPRRILNEFGGYSKSKKIAMDYDLILKILHKYSLSIFKPVDVNLTTYEMGGISEKRCYLGFWESYLSKFNIFGFTFKSAGLFLMYVARYFVATKVKHPIFKLFKAQ